MTRFLRWGLVLVMALVLTSCSPIYRWHQKLTLIVTTPAGEVSGSSVSEVAIQHPRRWENPLADVARKSDQRGEAVMVEVAPGKYLFALLQESNQLLAFKTFFNVINPTEEQSRALTRKAWTATLPAELYPMLVTFGDVARPESVMQVDPANLAASFGPGYALKAITLTITDEPVTKGNVEKVLGWLPDYKSKHLRLNGQRCIACPVDNSFAESIGTGDFQVGEGK